MREDLRSVVDHPREDNELQEPLPGVDDRREPIRQQRVRRAVADRKEQRQRLRERRVCACVLPLLMQRSCIVSIRLTQTTFFSRSRLRSMYCLASCGKVTCL